MTSYKIGSIFSISIQTCGHLLRSKWDFYIHGNQHSMRQKDNLVWWGSNWNGEWKSWLVLCCLIMKKVKTCSEIYIISVSLDPIQWVRRDIFIFFNYSFIIFSWVVEIIELLLYLFLLAQVSLRQVCASGVAGIQMHVRSHYWTELTPGLPSMYDKIRLKPF